MSGFGKLVIALIVFLIGVFYYKDQEEKKRKQRELEAEKARKKEEARKKLYDFFRSKLDRIRQANKEIARLLDIATGYFTNYQLSVWKETYSDLFYDTNGKSFEDIKLSAEEVNEIKTFRHQFYNAPDLRSQFNNRFIKEELNNYSKFFDKIEDRKLDKQQRTAVVTDDDNNIVIAGAGSGKTTTIVGKVSYVLHRYKVSPSEILLISFTNKSAATLAERINIDGVEAKTFHKFGMDVIAAVEEKKPSIFDEKQYKPLLTKFFTELIADGKYLKKVTDYFTEFLKPARSQFEFDNRGDYIQYIKDKNFRTYKLKEFPTNGRTSYKMEVVKSIEECKIANFLLFNGVEYEYEYPYEHQTANEAFRQYKPDFTLKQQEKKVYLEHLALSRNGDVPRFFTKPGETYQQAKDRYWEKVKWARELHTEKKTALVETFSYEMSEDILFENLSKNLVEAGVTLQPKSDQEIWKIINDAAKDEVKSFIDLFATFITLMKSNNYSIADVAEKNKRTKEAFYKKRNALFLEMVKPIYERYQEYLAERGEIDFSDMINKAAESISSGQYKRKFSYVIIDEFQDISIGRYQLIKAIKARNPACKLFCVGDDWQSIYRFSGSDIALFKEFEKYFGYTVKSKIETTYRFHKPLIGLSSDFILKNPNQEKKKLQSTSNFAETKHDIRYSISGDQDDTLAVRKIFDELIEWEEEIEKKEVILLGRYGFDIDRLKNEDRSLIIDRQNGTVAYRCATEHGPKQINARFLTVHKAKGLEADIVIVLNCNSGKHGFPSELSDDPVLNLLLSEADQFENGEERRLFYVAMTRAKERVFFVADSAFKSKFIAELEVESGQSPNKKCPMCKTADMVVRKTGIAKTGSRYKFYGCTNFLYGCDHTTFEYEN